jgi:hypothetical protein
MSVNQLYISNLSTLAGGTLEIKRQGVKSDIKRIAFVLYTHIRFIYYYEVYNTYI